MAIDVDTAVEAGRPSWRRFASPALIVAAIGIILFLAFGLGLADHVSDKEKLQRALEDAGIVAEDVALRRPTLDEVFLRLTGQPIETEAAGHEEVVA